MSPVLDAECIGVIKFLVARHPDYTALDICREMQCWRQCSYASIRRAFAELDRTGHIQE